MGGNLGEIVKVGEEEASWEKSESRAVAQSAMNKVRYGE